MNSKWMLVSSALLLVCGSGAYAQEYGGTGVVGHVGASAGAGRVQEVDGSSPDVDWVPYLQFEGSVAARSGLWMYGVEGNLRFDNFRSANDFDDGEDPEWQAMITGHLLYDLNSATRVGGFLQYADTLPQDGDRGDAYDLFLLGISGQTFLADNVLVYGQAAYGDKVRNGQDDDEGFYNGAVLRSGLTYFLEDSNAITLDFEFAASENYIDSSDPGRHFGFTLSQERAISTTRPLFANYGISYVHINSTDEGEQIDEWTLFAGIRYVFGHQTVRDRWANGLAIGSPRLPVRASAWTEYMD